MAMRANNTLMFFGLAAMAVCIFFGKSITVLPFYIPIILSTSLFIFLLAFTHANWVLMLLIFAMLLSPEIGLGSFSAQQSIVVRIEDLLIIVFALAWLAKTAITRRGLVIKTPINRYITFYIVVFLFSTIRGMITTDVKLLHGFFYIAKYLEYFLIFYLTLGNLKDKYQFKSFVKAMLITFAIVNVYAIGQIGQGVRVSAPFEGEIGEPNTLGGYQVLMLGVVLGLITHMDEVKWKIPLSILAILTLLPFMYTLSRSSYMSIFPMYLMLIIFNKSKRRNILIAVLIALVMCSFFFIPENVKMRIQDTFTPHEQQYIKPAVIMGIEFGPSASARIQDWVRLYQEWKQSPYFGYGLTGAGFVDGQYIKTMVELGAIGFVAFISLIGGIYIHTLRIYKSTKDSFLRGLAIGFLAGHVGMLFHAMTANTFILIRIMEPYWFLLAMVMTIPKLEALEQKKVVVQELKKETSPMHDLRNISFLLGNGRYQNFRQT